MPAKPRKGKIAKPTLVEPPVPAISKSPVSLGLALQLRELDRALFAEFGLDMAYVVLGGAKVLAASDATHGHMLASVKDEPPDGKVYTLAELWNSQDHTKIIHPVHGVGCVKAAGKADDEFDDRVVTFESGAVFVVPAPVASPPPWDVPITLIRSPGETVNTAYAPV